jgi:hypothetical protein
MRVEGQCHCGAIAYEAEVEPGTVRALAPSRGQACPRT